MTSVEPGPEKYHQNGVHGWAKELWYAISVASQLGFEIALPPVLLMAFGRWLDDKWGSGPLLTLAGAALGLYIAYSSARSMLLPLFESKKDRHDR